MDIVQYYWLVNIVFLAGLPTAEERAAQSLAAVAVEFRCGWSSNVLLRAIWAFI